MALKFPNYPIIESMVFCLICELTIPVQRKFKACTSKIGLYFMDKKALQLLEKFTFIT